MKDLFVYGETLAALMLCVTELSELDYETNTAVYRPARPPFRES